MSYEYFNILSKPLESRATISVVSLAHHSVWNLISIMIHFFIGFQMFAAFKQYLWLVIGSLAVCHFSIQRKMLMEVWRAQNFELIIFSPITF